MLAGVRSKPALVSPRGTGGVLEQLCAQLWLCFSSSSTQAGGATPADAVGEQVGRDAPQHSMIRGARKQYRRAAAQALPSVR